MGQTGNSKVDVSSGQAGSDNVVVDGGFLAADGGVAISTAVSALGLVVGGKAEPDSSGTTISGAGYGEIHGLDGGTTIPSGGSVYVSSGGTVSGTIISNSGYDEANVGGLAVATKIKSGGALVAEGDTLTGETPTDTEAVSGAVAAVAMVHLGGSEIVSSGDVAIGAPVVGAIVGGMSTVGGTQFISSGGTVTSPTSSAAAPNT